MLRTNFTEQKLFFENETFAYNKNKFVLTNNIINFLKKLV